MAAFPMVDPDRFRDTDPTAHTTNPRVSMSESCCPAPQTAEGKVITSLRNRYHFPSAANTPHENDIDLNYYHLSPIGNSFRPKKHWAYIGEITDMMKISRLMLSTRDMAGNKLPIWFYLDYEGINRRRRQPGGPFRICNPDFSISERGTAVEDGVSMAVGQTIVVVYPELHDFQDSSTGIRIDYDERMGFKILPYSLLQLLEANDMIVSQKLPNFQAKCHHCTNDKGGSLRCERCKVSYYCNKDCQAADWKPNPDSSPSSPGHKFMCKLYREVKWFTDQDWDDYMFRQGIRFPRSGSDS